MNANRRSPEVHDVVIIGSGASGGMAAWNLTRKGMQRPHARCRARNSRAQVLEPRQALEVPQELAAGQKPPQFYVDLKSSPSRRRPDIPSTWFACGDAAARPTSGAACRCAIPTSISPGPARRLGDSLADPLQRHRAILRQGGPVHRRLRRRRRSGFAARQPVIICRRPRRAAANACCQKAAGKHRHQHCRRPPRRPHPPPQRTRRLPLLRRLRPRLRYRRVLQFVRLPARTRIHNRPAEGHRQRRRRARAGRRRRPRQRRAILRPLHQRGAHRARPRGDRGGLLHRFHAHPAELEVAPAIPTASAIPPM